MKAAIIAAKGPEVVETASGPAQIETYTVIHDRTGPAYAILFGRDGEAKRFIANTPDDKTLLADMIIRDYCGLTGKVRANDGGINIFTPKPDTAEAALELYYDTIPDSALPSAGEGAAMPAADAVLTRILIGSCMDEEKGPSAAMMSIAGEEADLFLMVGDNVYGDRDGRSYVNNQTDLDELRESFADLAARADFQAVRAAHPMMVAWDDHDYGANDSGKEFPFRALAERVHEVFWGLEDEDVGQWPGTYYARSFGPEGQRVQVIMLDTRFFRSSLTPTDEWGGKGKERYLPAPAGSMQDMLGAAQWTWL